MKKILKKIEYEYFLFGLTCYNLFNQINLTGPEMVNDDEFKQEYGKIKIYSREPVYEDKNPENLNNIRVKWKLSNLIFNFDESDEAVAYEEDLDIINEKE